MPAAREPPSDVRDLLVQAQGARRSELGRDLRAFAEKSSVDAKWTRTEDEKRAPRRALLKTAGKER